MFPRSKSLNDLITIHDKRYMFFHYEVHHSASIEKIEMMLDDLEEEPKLDKKIFEQIREKNQKEAIAYIKQNKNVVGLKDNEINNMDGEKILETISKIHEAKI